LFELVLFGSANHFLQSYELGVQLTQSTVDDVEAFRITFAGFASAEESSTTRPSAIISAVPTARGANLTGTANLVTVTLSIGDNSGSTNIDAEDSMGMQSADRREHSLLYYQCEERSVHSEN